MEQTTVTTTFIINDSSFEHNMSLNAVRKAGMIANIMDDTGYNAGDELMPVVLSGLNIQEKYQEKVVSIMVHLLNYLTTANGEEFMKETIDVSNDYENEEIDKLFNGLPFAYYSHIINVANFLNVPSVFNYLVSKFAKIIRDRTQAKAADASN